jgi:hypothetical protein
MAEQGGLPSVLAWAPRRAPIPLILLAIGPAAMMFTGHAGEPSTPVLVRAALLFWLILHIAVQVAVVKLNRRLAPQERWSTWFAWVGAIFGSLYVIGLMALDVERGELLTDMLLIAIGVGLLLGLWLGLRRTPNSVAAGDAATS